MKVREIKYMCALSRDTGMVCNEQLPGCSQEARIHVCFEEGIGTFVCKHCFDKHVNDGDWITDSAEVLLAS